MKRLLAMTRFPALRQATAMQQVPTIAGMLLLGFFAAFPLFYSAGNYD